MFRTMVVTANITINKQQKKGEKERKKERKKKKRKKGTNNSRTTVSATSLSRPENVWEEHLPESSTGFY